MSVFMGVGVNIFSIMKWGLRLALIAFLLIGVILYFNKFDIFTPLVSEHTTTTLVLVGLGCLAFLPLMVPKPKKRNKEGGEEKVMRKLHILIIAVVTVLVSLCAWLLMDTEGAKGFIGGIGGGAGEGFVGFAVTVNTWMGSLPPYALALGSGIFGVLLTVLAVNLLIPKIKAKINPLPKPTYSGAPAYIPPQTIAPTTTIPPPTITEEETV